MPDLPLREGYEPRHAVTHEMTADGLKIVADQVVTASFAPLGDNAAPDGLTRAPAPLGEAVRADPVVTADEVLATPELEPVVIVAAMPEPAPQPEPFVAEPMTPAPDTEAIESRSTARRRSLSTEE